MGTTWQVRLDSPCSAAMQVITAITVANSRLFLLKVMFNWVTVSYCVQKLRLLFSYIASDVFWFSEMVGLLIPPLKFKNVVS